MNSVCIIPARGGSKRIPKKNIKDFFGKPIITYSIQTALASSLFEEVMVSTDDEEIATVAKQYGANVPFFRSEANSSDYATTVEVMVEVLEKYQAQGRSFDTACCIYPTAPLISSSRLKEGFETLIKEKYDTVFPILRFSYPIWRALVINNNKVKMAWPENLNKRSQDLPESFHDAGQWYWFRCKQLLESHKLWTDNSFGIKIEEMEAQDIDNLSDWKLAELKYELQNS